MNKRAKSETIEKTYASDFFNLVSSQEEAIVAGPRSDKFQNAMENFNLFHIEIFTALAGKQAELIKQRQNENLSYVLTQHRPNFIFRRVFGPSWDIFTMGWYKDIVSSISKCKD